MPKKKSPDPPAGHAVLEPKVSYAARTIAAGPGGCLSMEDAAALVESCIGGGPHSADTPIGELFPLENARLLFCQRVNRAARDAGCTVPPAGVACTPSTTLGEVADSLTC